MDVVALTGDLIRFNTVSAESNVELSDYLTGILTSLGMSVTVQNLEDAVGVAKRNIIGFLPATTGKDTGGLLLAGHMDTVPFHPDQRSNLTPVFDRGRVYGRGACDMKGGIAAVLVAASRFKDVPLRRPLTVALTCDEEIGMGGARALMTSGLIHSRHAVVAEPTALVPVRMHKGYCTAHVQLLGKSCHSSDPQLGINALKAATRVLAALETLEQEFAAEPAVEEAAFEPNGATLNVGLFSAGSAKNVVPDVCDFSLELRHLPGQDARQLMARLQQTITSVAKSHGASTRFKIERCDPPMQTDGDSEIVNVLELMSGQPSGAASHATEGFIYSQMGMDTVIFGPGCIRNAHRPDEYVSTAQLSAAVDILSATIQQICG